MSSDQSPVDAETLDSLRELMEEEFPALVQSYLDDTHDILGKINDAIENGDNEELKLHAHALKSSSANMGTLGVSGNAAELERLGKEGTTGNAAPLFDKVREESARVRAVLERELQTFCPGGRGSTRAAP